MRINLLFLAISTLLVHTSGSLHGAEPAAPSPQPSSAVSRRIVIVGDSLTEGYGVAEKDALPAVLQGLLSQRLNGSFQVINAGTSGATSASAASKIEWQLRSKQLPDVIVLALGANDGLRGINPADTKRNLTLAIQSAKKKGVRVVLAGMQVPPNYGPEYTEAYKAIFPAIARSEKIRLIPFLLEGVAAKRDLNLPDGIHPNEKGYQIVAENVFAVLREELP